MINDTEIIWNDEIKHMIYGLRDKYKLQGTTIELLEIQQKIRDDISYKKNKDIFAIGICILLDDEEFFHSNSWEDISKYFETMYKTKTYDVSLNTIEEINLFHDISDNNNKCLCNKTCKISNMFNITHKKNTVVVGCECITKISIELNKDCKKQLSEYKKNYKKTKEQLIHKLTQFVYMKSKKYEESIKSVLQKAFNKIKGKLCSICKKPNNNKYEQCLDCYKKKEGKTFCECGKLYKYRNTSYTCCYNCMKVYKGKK